jgi:Zn-dependent peptidase ImmA (M78 family)
MRQNIQAAAYELLEKSGCMSLPVKVNKVACHLGAKIYPVELPDDISGILDVRSEPIILINKDHALHRQRFSIAHELGHFQLHHVSGIIHIDKKSYYRDAKSSEGLDEIEIAANKFAAALLMPEEFVRQELGKYEDFIDIDEDIVADLAREFEVSATAMGFRIQNLGYSWF